MKKLCFLLVFIIFLASCKDKTTDVDVLSIDVASDLATEPSIFDMFTKVELDVLSSPYPISNHVFSGEKYITSDGLDLYILDERNFSIQVFDMDGNFKLRADRVGRSHQEFTMGYQIGYNEDNCLIEVLNPMGKIMRYTPDSMSFDSVIDMTGKGLLAMHEFFRMGEEYVIHSRSIEDRYWCLDPEEEKISSFGYKVAKEFRNYFKPTFSFFRLRDKVCSFRSIDGEIFCFDKETGSIQTLYKWDLGNYQAKMSDIPENKSVREYDEIILEYSKTHLSPFLNIKSYESTLYCSVVYDGQIYPYTIVYDLSTGESELFGKTKEGMWFLPELFVDGVMYKYIDAQFLPKYVNREILDPDSRAAYDEILESGGSGVIKYYLD